MMKRKFLLLFFTLGLVTTIGCSYSYSQLVNTVDVASVDLTKEMKKGKACETRILGIIPIGGRASIVEAARSKNIQKIDAVDNERNYYVVFAQDCVIVHGN